MKVPGLDLRGGVLFAGVNGNPRAVSPDNKHFGPATGFAYSPFAKTVLRGGYGLFYSTIALNTTFFGALNVYNALRHSSALTTPVLRRPLPWPIRFRQDLCSRSAALWASWHKWETR